MGYRAIQAPCRELRPAGEAGRRCRAGWCPGPRHGGRPPPSRPPRCAPGRAWRTCRRPRLGRPGRGVGPHRPPRPCGTRAPPSNRPGRRSPGPVGRRWSVSWSTRNDAAPRRGRSTTPRRSSALTASARGSTTRTPGAARWSTPRGTSWRTGGRRRDPAGPGAAVAAVVLAQPRGHPGRAPRPAGRGRAGLRLQGVRGFDQGTGSSAGAARGGGGRPGADGPGRWGADDACPPRAGRGTSPGPTSPGPTSSGPTAPDPTAPDPTAPAGPGQSVTRVAEAFAQAWSRSSLRPSPWLRKCGRGSPRRWPGVSRRPTRAASPRPGSSARRSW